MNSARVSWSRLLLSPPAARLFRLLSLHPAADITAAASASLLGVYPDKANRLMAELANTSLISEDRPGRYSFHDLIRAYAAEVATPAVGPQARSFARQMKKVQSVLGEHQDSVVADQWLGGVFYRQCTDFCAIRGAGAGAGARR